MVQLPPLWGVHIDWRQSLEEYCCMSNVNQYLLILYLQSALLIFTCLYNITELTYSQTILSGISISFLVGTNIISDSIWSPLKHQHSLIEYMWHNCNTFWNKKKVTVLLVQECWKGWTVVWGKEGFWWGEDRNC